MVRPFGGGALALCEPLEARRLLAGVQVELLPMNVIPSSPESNNHTLDGPKLGMLAVIKTMDTVQRSVTISWEFLSGTALEYEDYEPAPPRSADAVIPPYVVNCPISPAPTPPYETLSLFGQVETLADNLVEGTESFRTRFTIAGGKFVIGGTPQNPILASQVTLDYVITDSPPLVTVGTFNATASEAGASASPPVPGEISLTRQGGDLASPLTVTANINHQTTTPEDLQPLGEITFEAMSTATVAQVFAVDDAFWEPTETAEFVLADPGDAYDVLGNNKAGVAVPDNDWRVTAAQVDAATVRVSRDFIPQGETDIRYPAVEWVDNDGNGSAADAGENASPIAIGRSVPGGDRFLTLTPQFTLQGNLDAGNYTLTGTGNGLTWSKAFNYGGGNIAPGAIRASQPMGELIDARPLEIKWTLSTAGGLGRMQYTSKNPLYVTGVDPSEGQYHTVLKIGCTGAKGKRPRNPGEQDPDASNRDREVMEEIWKNTFATRKIKRTLDDEVLKYWDTYAGNKTEEKPEFFTVAGLLAHADGRCMAWAKLLVAVLGQQGVSAESDNIEVIRPVPLVPFPGPAAYRFSDMKIDTIPAQSGAIPSINEFSNHELVKCNGRIYDPSYGLDFASLADWEEQSVTHIISVYERPDGTQIIRTAPQLPNEQEVDFV